MKAVQFAEYGEPEVLRVVDVVQPHAGAGQIRVAVRAAGVNPVDWKLRSGAYAQVMPIELPSIPGTDVAGVIDEVDVGVSGVAVGDEVFGFAVTGAAAQYALLEHYAVKPSPCRGPRRPCCPSPSKPRPECWTIWPCQQAKRW